MSQKQLTGKQSDFLKIVVATAARGDLESTREFVDNKPKWIHTVGSHGRTMLWESAYRGKQEVVQFLVERGADVNICGCHYTPHLVDIHSAAYLWEIYRWWNGGHRPTGRDATL